MTGTPRMTESPKKHRARRIASDEAHAWARSVPLNNPYGKTVLRALTLYVNGEGCCFVSLDQLAEDTDLSIDTVRRRLVWLDSVGAIVRMHQWIDANGRRNSEGRGKRTTDEIRLLVDADLDEIERRCKGEEVETEAPPPEVSPSTENDAQDSVSPRLVPPPAVGQPSQSRDPLISEPEPEPEPEPEGFPQTPSGGSVESDNSFKDFETAWLDPMTRPSLARQVWSVLTADERATACQAASGYFLWRKAQPNPPHCLSAHLFLREREAWPRFAEITRKATGFDGDWIAEGSDEDRVLRFIGRWGNVIIPMVRPHPTGGPRGYPWQKVINPDLLAMRELVGSNELRWGTVDIGSAEYAAWQQRIRVWVGGEIRPQPGDKFIRVPDQWPPSKDGIRYTDDANEATRGDDAA
jgi:hypothetical protein